MSVRDRFSGDNPFVLSALIATARSNQADLQVAIRENDHLRSTSAYFQSQGLTNNPANPVSNVTLVAQQTVGNAVGDGEIPDPRCPEVNQWVLVNHEGVPVPRRASTLTLDDLLYNPITKTFEKVTRADIVDSALWTVSTINGVKVTGSPTTPLIIGTWDAKGHPLEKCETNMNVLSLLENLEYTKLRAVTRKRKKGQVVHLSTEGPTHIYCAGTMADKFLMLHNRKPDS